MEGKSREKGRKGLSAIGLTMMALGSVIGGSFFLGSAVAIKTAGPSIVLAYILGGILVYFILSALSEMTAQNPEKGSFRSFAEKAFGPGMGFMVGWIYWTGMVLAMSSEATAIAILVKKWFPGLSIPLYGGLVILVVTLLNLLGADKLSRLESGLAAIKLLTIVSFIALALLLILGLLPNRTPLGMGSLAGESFMPNGIKGLAGSLLIVMFSYAGFEIIGLATSETEQPEKNVPRAIRYTVFSLVGLYVVSICVLLPLVPTDSMGEDVSPMVAALLNGNIGGADRIINLVLITAILSTMLAAMFGLGRMLRSLAEDGLTPRWLKDKGEVPHRGILFSGLAMLISLGIGLLLPSVYLFLISSGGFALLFTYAVIMASHIRLQHPAKAAAETKQVKPGKGRASSWMVLFFLAAAIFSMPFAAGQEAGLFAGAVMLVVYGLAYFFLKRQRRMKAEKIPRMPEQPDLAGRAAFLTEFSRELALKSEERDISEERDRSEEQQGSEEPEVREERELTEAREAAAEEVKKIENRVLNEEREDFEDKDL